MTPPPHGDSTETESTDAPGGQLPVTRLSLVTREESEATALIEQLYSGLRLRIAAQQAETDFAARSASVDSIRAERLRNAMRFTSRLEPFTALSAGVVLNGLVGLDDGRHAVRLGRGDVLLHRMDTPVTSEMVDMDVAMLTLPLEAVASLAETMTGIAPGDLRFTATTALTPELGRYFADVVTFVHRQLISTEVETLSPLMAEQLLHLAASALLMTFPNTAMVLDRLPRPGLVPASVLRRAIDYIEEHADHALTVGDIARAVGISPRGLQAAFAREETTPMTYWRRVRLQRAHDDLEAGDPTAGTTVAEVATRWGFAHPGRFARLYATIYGRSPSTTLLRRSG